MIAKLVRRKFLPKIVRKIALISLITSLSPLLSPLLFMGNPLTAFDFPVICRPDFRLLHNLSPCKPPDFVYPYLILFLFFPSWSLSFKSQERGVKGFDIFEGGYRLETLKSSPDI